MEIVTIVPCAREAQIPILGVGIGVAFARARDNEDTAILAPRLLVLKVSTSRELRESSLVFLCCLKSRRQRSR
jgi:hypothetical protein